jgi:hypothetical protein
MNKRKLGGIRLIPGKSALKYLFFLSKRYSRGLETGSRWEPAAPTRRTDPLVKRTSTVCGPDPEPNLYPASREMEPAGHPPRKIAKRKPAPDGSRQPQPDEPTLLSDERVLCAGQTPSLTSFPRRARWSRQVTHLGKSLRGNARNQTNRISCQTNEYYVRIGPRAQPPPQTAGDGAGRSPTWKNR